MGQTGPLGYQCMNLIWLAWIIATVLLIFPPSFFWPISFTDLPSNFLNLQFIYPQIKYKLLNLTFKKQHHFAFNYLSNFFSLQLLQEFYTVFRLDKPGELQPLDFGWHSFLPLDACISLLHLFNSSRTFKLASCLHSL